jgi:hypothetical protein
MRPEQRRLEAKAMGGQKLRTPDDREIPVDYDALRELQKSGLLNGRRTHIKIQIFRAMARGLLSDRLRNHIGGMDLLGPNVCICNCQECRDREGA